MTIIAEKMIFGGDCLAKVDGKAVLVSGALPGETVSVALTESHRDYDRARVTAILEPSPDRVEPQCELYGTCGGCSLMHCASKAQRQLRRQLLQDCFMREGIDCPPIATIAGPDFGYRSRFQFFDGGLRRRSSHECVMPSRCPIAESPINDWLEQVPPKERPTGRIQVFGSQYAGGALVIGTRATAHRQRAQTPRARFSGTVIDPQKVAVVTVAGARIAFDVRGFFQSNLFVLERAVNEICLPLPAGSILDMYSGCGTFSALLKNRARHLTLVEHNRDALVFAEQNIAGTAHDSYGMTGARWAAEQAPAVPFDGLVIDPPRSGMERAVRDWISRSGIPVISAISCNPATQARDVRQLLDAGYRLERLVLLDFYPQTSHIESLAVLKHRERL